MNRNIQTIAEGFFIGNDFQTSKIQWDPLYNCYISKNVTSSEAFLDDLIYRIYLVADYHVTPILISCISIMLLFYFVFVVFYLLLSINIH